MGNVIHYRHSEIYGDARITYSDIQGGYDSIGNEEGNIDEDPRFVDTFIGDQRLQPGSPAIDAGNNTAVPVDTYDLDGDGDKTEPLPYDRDGSSRTEVIYRNSVVTGRLIYLFTLLTIIILVRELLLDEQDGFVLIILFINVLVLLLATMGYRNNSQLRKP